MKNFLKAMVRDGCRYNYVGVKFNTEKNLEVGIFIWPEIKELLFDCKFRVKLNVFLQIECN